MVRKLSQRSDELKELILSPAALQQRWGPIVRELRAQLNLSESDFNVVLTPSPTAIFAEIIGSACEYIERQKGGKTPVIPFTNVRRGELKSWLGLQEKWEQKSKNQFAFRYVSLTVHLGYPGEVSKPQIFRAEWPGIADWDSSGLGFQSPRAGHPHWQFDALVALRDQSTSVRQLSLSRLRSEGTPTEFRGGEAKADILLDVTYTAFERLHFASAAPWWRRNVSDIYGVHMNAPSSAEDVARWILETVAYVKDELGRCGA